jgi:hypothetical protein
MTMNVDKIISRLNKFSLIFLISASWVSSLIFALFIFGMYFIPHSVDELANWNRDSLYLYSPSKPIAMTGMLTHIFFGSLLLIMGPIQFSERIRTAFISFHRWTGLLFTMSSFMAGLGGLIYLSILGSVGGRIMTVAFAIGGLMLIVCSIQTIRYAMLREFVTHRQWATRLFSIVIASWMYRIDYAFIKIGLHEWGTGPLYTGPLDHFMDFAFYLAPLLVAEVIIRSRDMQYGMIWKALGFIIFVALGSWVCFATFILVLAQWGKPILSLFHYLF